MPVVSVGFGTQVTFLTSGFTAQLTRLFVFGIARNALPASHMALPIPVAPQMANRVFLRGKLVNPGRALLQIHLAPGADPPLHQPPETIIISWPRGTDLLYTRWEGLGFVVKWEGAIALDGVMTGQLTVQYTSALTSATGTSPTGRNWTEPWESLIDFHPVVIWTEPWES